MMPCLRVKKQTFAFQFSLRTLLCAMLVVCIAAFLWSLKVDQKRGERAFAADVRGIGGVVMYNWEWQSDRSSPPGPVWMRRAFGENIFADITFVSFFQNQTIDDRRFLGLSLPRGIRQLDLSSTRITDYGLRRINELTKLHILSVQGTAITDAALGQVEAMTELQSLSIADTRITDDGLARLRSLVKLTELHLDRTRITDFGLGELAQLKSLRWLYIEDCNVTLGGVRALKSMLPQCEVTWLLIRNPEELEAMRQGKEEAVLELRARRGAVIAPQSR